MLPADHRERQNSPGPSQPTRSDALPAGWRLPHPAAQHRFCRPKGREIRAAAPPPPRRQHGAGRRARGGPGQHGAAHPRPACPLTCGNLGAALRRGERPPESGPAPLALLPPASAVPSAVTTSPYRLATPPRAPPLARPRPRPLFLAPALGAGPALRVPFPLCASPSPPLCEDRGGGALGNGGTRPEGGAGLGSAPSWVRPGALGTPSYFSFFSSPPFPLPRNSSGGQGLASPRGRLRAALPRLSLDCGEE